MDKQRELFEVWAADNGYAMNKITADCYTNMFTQIAWDAWQAAIASVVVELPKPENENWGCLPYERGLVDGMNAMLEDCQSAVERSGLSYK